MTLPNTLQRILQQNSIDCSIIIYFCDLMSQHSMSLFFTMSDSTPVFFFKIKILFSREFLNQNKIAGSQEKKITFLQNKLFEESQNRCIYNWGQVGVDS